MRGNRTCACRALHGLPAGLLGQAAVGQRSLTLGQAEQWAGRPSSEEALVIVFLCVAQEALSAFAAVMYVFSSY